MIANLAAQGVDDQTPVDVTHLAPAYQEHEPVKLEPIDYSDLTTDDLCALWLTIPPDDVRREEKLAELTRCLSGKADRLDELHAMSEANAAAFDAMADKYRERYVEPLEERAEQERNRAKGIESLLMFVMKKNELVELDGTQVRVSRVVTNKHNPESNWKRQPTVNDMAKYGDTFVGVVPERYEWNTANCKRAVMDGTLTDFDALELKLKEKIKFEAIVEVHAIPPRRKAKRASKA